jgi:Type II secretion system (T2SS), protein E, N-terminal domain
MWQAATDSNESGGTAEVESPVGRPALGTMLTERDFITREQLAEALEEGAENGERLGEVIVRRGWVSEDELAKLLAEQWQLGFLDRASIWFDGHALGRITREDAQRLEALPTSVQDGRVVVAVAEPTQQRLSALREIMGDDAVIVVVPKSALDAGLRSDLLTGGGRAEDAVNTKEDTVYAEPTEWAAEDQPGPEVVADAVAGETDLVETLKALEAAERDASALQANVAELSGRLAEIAADVATASQRLSAAERARAESEARVAELEERLALRTEVGESLRSQLADLSRTLDGLT